MASLTSAIQQNLLVLLAFDEKACTIIRGIVEVNLFEGDYQEVVSRIYAHIDRYKKPPGEAHLGDLFEDITSDKNNKKAKQFKRLLTDIYELKENINVDYTMDSLTAFVREQRLKGAIIEAAELLQSDTENGAERAAEVLSESTKFSLDFFDPGIFLNDPKRGLEFLNPDDSDVFLTGIKEFDRIGVGPARKELFLFVAPAKRGKCVALGEHILLADGSYIEVQDFKGGEVVSLNETTKAFEKKSATLSYNGKKRIIEIVTRSGRKVKLTEKHPVLTPTGWVEVRHIKTGDAIAAPCELPFFGNEVYPEKSLRALGYLIADGGLTKGSTPTFSKQENEVLEDFKVCIETLGCVLKPVKEKAHNYYVINNSASQHKHGELTKLLKETKLFGKKSNQKHIPDFIFRLKKEMVAQFLSTLFTCDGSIYETKTGGTFEYSTTSKILTTQINHLLIRFGITATVRERWQTVNKRPYVSWSIIFRDREQIKILHDEIGLIGKKGKKLKHVVKKEFPRKGRKSYIKTNQENQIFFDKVVSKTVKNKMPTYDLSVNDNHNFIANDIVVHNTWALCNLGKFALLQRKKVCHVSLEMSAKKMVQRYYQSIFNMSKRKEKSLYVEFERNTLGRIIDIKMDELFPQYSMDDPRIHRKLTKRINNWGHRLGHLVTKEFPTGSLTLNMLKAYLDNLEAASNFIPDLLIVDYPDLMDINVNNYRLDLGKVYKDLRGIAVERNIAIAIASQANRGGAEAQTVTDTDIAEDYSKIATVDNVVTYSQTQQEKELGCARLFLANGRNDADRFSVLISQNYNTGQFVLDSVPLYTQRSMQSYFELVKENVGEVDDEDY